MVGSLPISIHGSWAKHWILWPHLALKIISPLIYVNLLFFLLKPLYHGFFHNQHMSFIITILTKVVGKWRFLISNSLQVPCHLVFARNCDGFCVTYSLYIIFLFINFISLNEPMLSLENMCFMSSTMRLGPIFSRQFCFRIVLFLSEAFSISECIQSLQPRCPLAFVASSSPLSSSMSFTSSTSTFWDRLMRCNATKSSRWMTRALSKYYRWMSISIGFFSLRISFW